MTIPPGLGPETGQIVHFVPVAFLRKEQHRAAIVTEVSSGDPLRVGLAIVGPTGWSFRPLADGGCAADFSESPAGGTWHWTPCEDGHA
jgi:hypothetical protein